MWMDMRHEKRHASPAGLFKDPRRTPRRLARNVVDDVLLDFVGIMRPPGEDGIGYSTDFPHDPDEFDFANDVLWGRELGAIVQAVQGAPFRGVPDRVAIFSGRGS